MSSTSEIMARETAQGNEVYSQLLLLVSVDAVHLKSLTRLKVTVLSVLINGRHSVKKKSNSHPRHARDYSPLKKTLGGGVVKQGCGGHGAFEKREVWGRGCACNIRPLRESHTFCKAQLTCASSQAVIQVLHTEDRTNRFP